MDQFTIGALGLAFMLSRCLNKKESYMTARKLDSPVYSNFDDASIDDQLFIALKNNDTGKVKQLLPSANDEGVKKKAIEYLNSTGCMNMEKMNWENYQKQALKTVQDKPLKDYVHNNFVPFYKGHNTPNMAGTGISNGNYTHSSMTGEGGKVKTGFGEETPYEGTLARHTGRGVGFATKSENPYKETTMFKPNEVGPTQHVSGTPLVRPESNRFVNPGGHRHDLKPTEAIRVGPGLNVGDDVSAAGGFQQFYRVEDNGITSAETTRGVEAAEPRAGAGTGGKTNAPFGAGLLANYDITKEGFEQGEHSADGFVVKRCASENNKNRRNFMASSGPAQGQEERGDGGHRGGTHRGNTDNLQLVGKKSATFDLQESRGNTYLVDNHCPTDRGQTGRMLGGASGQRGQTGNNYQAYGTDRGETTNGTMLGGAGQVDQGAAHTEKYTRETNRNVQGSKGNFGTQGFYGNGTSNRTDDNAKGTHRGKKLTYMNPGGKASQGMSGAAYYNMQGKETKHAGPQPVAGRMNILHDPSERSGTASTGDRGNNYNSYVANGSFSAFGVNQSGDFSSSRKVSPENNRDLNLGGLDAGYKQERLIPGDSKIDCRQ